MSNGSEHLDERCVHAVDGPDWAGLRELYPAEVDYEALVEVARARYKLASDEMDRLTAGNPGTNWRWSIPANPDRDSDLILSASAEDVPKLADAVEALLAENVKHRADLHEWETVGAPAWVAAKDAQIAEVRAERDALQARLDAMTVEWSTHSRPGSLSRLTPISEVQARREVSQHGHLRLMRRFVGPWTVVPEGDAD